MTADRKAGVATQTIVRTSIHVGAIADASFNEVVTESSALSAFGRLDSRGNLIYQAKTPTGWGTFRLDSQTASTAPVADHLLMTVPSADGTFVVGSRLDAGLARVNVDGSGSAVVLAESPAFASVFTRDGGGVVYVSNITRRSRVSDVVLISGLR